MLFNQRLNCGPLFFHLEIVIFLLPDAGGCVEAGGGKVVTTGRPSHLSDCALVSILKHRLAFPGVALCGNKYGEQFHLSFRVTDTWLTSSYNTIFADLLCPKFEWPGHHRKRLAKCPLDSMQHTNSANPDGR